MRSLSQPAPDCLAWLKTSGYGLQIKLLLLFFNAINDIYTFYLILTSIIRLNPNQNLGLATYLLRTVINYQNLMRQIAKATKFS
jgi:hypothetical protein